MPLEKAVAGLVQGQRHALSLAEIVEGRGAQLAVLLGIRFHAGQVGIRNAAVPVALAHQQDDVQKPGFGGLFTLGKLRLQSARGIERLFETPVRHELLHLGKEIIRSVAVNLRLLAAAGGRQTDDGDQTDTETRVERRRNSHWSTPSKTAGDEPLPVP